MVCLKALLGGAAGWPLGILFAAVVGAALTLGIGLLDALIEPSPQGMQPAADAPLMAVLLIGYLGASLTPPVGILSGAATLASGNLRAGFATSILSSFIPVVKVCVCPNWYGGIEEGSLAACAEPALTWYAISFAAGSLVVFSIHFGAARLQASIRALRSRLASARQDRAA